MKKIFKIRYILLGVLIFESLLLAGLYFKGTGNNELPNQSSVSQKTLQNEVLGNFYNPGPVIYISGSGQNQYSAGGMISQASTDDPSVEIGGYNVSGDATIDVYQTNIDKLFDYLLHDSEDKQVNKQVDISGMTYISTVKNTFNNKDYSNSRVSLPVQGKGIWFVRLHLGGTTVDSYLVRSDTGVVVKQGDNQLVFWGQDYHTHRSITQGTIKIYNLTGSKNELASAVFDTEGIAKTSVSAQADLAVAEIGNDQAIIPLNMRYLNSGYGNYSQFTAKQIDSKFFLFTDRPLYRPGDTVYFKTILRDDDDARYSIPQGSVVVKIFQGSASTQNNPVFQKTIPVSANGTIDGQYQLPQDAITDSYTIALDTVGEDKPEFYYYSNTVSFDVQYFRKPDQYLEMKALKTDYISGDMANVTVSGSYFSGQPIRNQTIKYSVYASDYFEYSYLSDYNYQQSLSDDYRYRYYYGSNAITSGTVTLDSKGQAQIQVNTKSGGGKSKIFSIEAEYDGGIANPSFARKNILVRAAEFGIFRKDYSYSSKVGEPLTLPVVLKSYQGGIISNKNLTALISRTSWTQYQDPNQKYSQYKQETQNYPEIKAATDTNGSASFTFTPNAQGSYKFMVQAADNRGNNLSTEFYFYVTDQSYTYFTQDNNDLTIRTDKEKYDPSEVAHLQIHSSTPDRDVFLVMERGRMDRYQILHLSGRSGIFDIPLNSTDIPNIFAQVSSFSSTNIDSGMAEINVSTGSKELKVAVTPDKSKYGPGEQVNINILTTDKTGNPLPAEVALWAVDKSLFELVSSNLGDIVDTFWRERYNSTPGSHSLAGIVVNNAEMGGCFAAGTKVLMANGQLKNIENIKIGDQILTRKSDNDETLVRGTVANTHSITEGGYLIINGSLRVTSNHKIFVNSQWKEAGDIQIGDLLTDQTGKSISVTSLQWQLGKFPVYNLQITKYQTFFANGIWVHNQKGGGDARSIFKDTAYWNPSIQTGGDGRSQISFKLPDNLTTWVISAVSHTINTQVGQTQGEITVSKDIIVRPILPNILRVGDQAKLSGLIQNFTDFDKKFDIMFKFDSGEIKQASRSAVTIKAQDTVQEYWDVVANKVSNTSKFTLSAKEIVATGSSTKALSDTVIQQIPIREFSFSDKRAQTGDGNKDFNVTLYPDSKNEKTIIKLSLASSLVGTLPTAMEYLIGYPYGCVEQTTSKLVPVLIAKANQSLFSEFVANKKLDDMVQTGLSRLKMQQRYDGGWTWYFSGESDPFITSYVVEYLLFAQNQGYTVDTDVLNKAREFLLANNPKDTPDTLVAKAYGRALLGLKEQKIIISNFKDLSADQLSLAVMANYLNGNKTPNTNGLDLLQQQAVQEGDAVFWKGGKDFHFGSSDASTAFAIRAILLSSGDRELAAKGIRYLVKSRYTDHWSNTFGTVQVLRAATDFSKSGNELLPNYTYTVKLDNKVIASGKVVDSQQKISDINIPAKSIQANGSTLSLSKNGDGQLYSTLIVNEYRTDQKAPAFNHGLNVKREYINSKGAEYSLGVGDIVDVIITISGQKSAANYAVVEDQLPAGLIPINEEFKNEQYTQSPSYGYYPYNLYDKEILENGAILSLYSLPANSQTYSYKARVISEGTFIVPPVVASLMYQPEVYGRSAPEVVIVDAQAKIIPGKSTVGPIISKTSTVLNAIKDKRSILIIITIVFVVILTVGLLFRKKIIIIIQKLVEKWKNKNTPPLPPLSNSQTEPV